jgi:EmrB/QacA subfamily drug resistance transporter
MKNGSGFAVNKNVVLVVATVTAFVMPFMVAAVNVALPTMGREFSMEAVVMTWVSTIYFLAIAMVQVPVGRLSDIYGRKKLFIIGLLLSIFSSFLAAFANSVAMLLVSRALMGVGSGVIFNNSIAILTSVFPAERRGRVLGISQAGTYTGISLGPYIGGALTEKFGWQSIFILAGLLCVVLLVLVFYALKGEWTEARGDKFDVVGSIAYGISIALFMYGFSSLPSVLGIGLFLAGLVGFLFFARWEARTGSPIFDLDLFRKNRVFFFSNLAVLINYVSTFAVSFLLSLYLQYIKGLTPQAAGLVLIVSSVLMAIFTPISGRISDRIEPRLVASAGIAANCVALLLLVFLDEGTVLWYIMVALAIYGFGIGLFTSPNSNAVMGSVVRKSLGVAAGTMGTMRTGGMMVSMGIMMILFSMYIGQAEITPTYYPQFLTSVRVGFIIFTVIGFGGMVAQIGARRYPERLKSG